MEIVFGKNKEDPQYAIHKMGYDALGHKVWEEYYGMDGKPCTYNERAFRYEYIFNDRGYCIEFRYYDVNGNLVRWEDSQIASSRLTYEEYGNIAKMEMYDENGTVVSWVENDYDQRGFLTKEALYGSNGRLNKDEVFFVSVTSVEAESPAEAAGIRRGDVLIQYGPWGIFQKEIGTASFEWMKTEINKNTSDEKIVIVAHPSATAMEFEFQKMDLPAGNIGIVIGKGTVASEYMDFLKEEYIRWAMTEE